MRGVGRFIHSGARSDAIVGIRRAIFTSGLENEVWRETGFRTDDVLARLRDPILDDRTLWEGV